LRNRRQGRELALQVIFQLDVAGGDPAEAFELAVRLAAEDPEEGAGPPPTDEAREFARKLLDGTLGHLAEIDAKLRSYAREWPLERMANVDRNILRLALYEMLYVEDVPLSVSINEAVELAKLYSTPDSGRFINGILGKIALDMQPAGAVASNETRERSEPGAEPNGTPEPGAAPREGAAPAVRKGGTGQDE